MDVVKNEITSLGGRVEIVSTGGRGTTFTITLPLTLAVTQAVMLRAGQTIYAVPSVMVEQVLELKGPAYAEMAAKGDIQWKDNRYALRSLLPLLGEIDTALPARQIPVLLLKSGLQRAAIRVDEIVGNREVVVKTIGPQLARLAGISGATVLGNGQVVLYDAYAEAKPSAALNLRVGKFKPPIGLERLQSATDVRFVERGLPTSLVPNRDVGVQLSGDLANARIQYQVGAFDGAPDAAIVDGDAAMGKDVSGRLFIRPFATNTSGPDLGIGIAGSSGTEEGTPSATGLGAYRTTGQLALFRYRGDGTAPNTVLADGRRTRVSPQGYLYVGPVGVLAEYVRATHSVRRATTVAALTNQAWQLSGGWVLTGERESYTSVTPERPLDGTKNGGLGALELVARYGVLTTDANAFPTFADPATQTRRARAAGVGLNWRLTRGLLIAADYERTQLEGPEAATVRSTEHAVLTRLQLGF
jgi:phosphate-selective porin